MNTDHVSETMRILFETAENNMVAQMNKKLISEVDGNYQISKLAQVNNLKHALLAVKKRADSMVSTSLNRVEGIELKRLVADNERATAMMIASTLTSYRRSVSQIVRLSETIPLKEAIKRQTQEGINNGVKIATAGGKRMVGYKEYMEMNVRTTVQREIGEMQMASGGQAGVVFYISNHFADCADDHKDYQGRIYYDERYATFGYDAETLARIQTLISSKRMLGVQSVREQAPYLTTRPNCRHTLTPISIEQAGGSASQLVSNLKLSSGSYRDENYEDLQQQRYNERQIRFYKGRMEANKELGYDDLVNRDKHLVSKWQATQRKLISSNEALSRDYRRETEKILLQDLGG